MKDDTAWGLVSADLHIYDMPCMIQKYSAAYTICQTSTKYAICAGPTLIT